MDLERRHLSIGATSHHVEGQSLTPEQIERRRSCLGASEIAAVAGLDPYANALDVFLRKTGIMGEHEGTGPSEWGHRLEDAIAQKYADVHQASLIKSDTAFHRTEKWMSASPDRLVLVPWEKEVENPANRIDRGLELKNRHGRAAHLFGESGTDIVPDDIAAQCHWSMIVHEITTWDAAVLIGGNDWRWFRLEFDNDIASALMERGHDFWTNNVLKGIAPPVDGSESWTRHLKSKFAKHSEELREASPEEAGMIHDLRYVGDMVKGFEKDKALVQNQLKAAIGETAGIVGPTGKVTWKQTKDSTGPDYQAIAFQLAGRLGLSLDEQKKLLADNTVTTKKGSRRFLASFPEDN